MRIEDNYKDVVIYNVEFMIENGRRCRKTIVFNMVEELTNKRVENIVLNTFKGIVEILHIEEEMDGLLLHDSSLYYL